MEGTYNLTLKINGVNEETRDITVAAGTSKSVSFTLSRQQSGIYEVDVNGLEGSFNVITLAPAPVPAPTPAPKPVIPSEPKPVPTPAPTPTTPAPVLPPTPEPPTNWWLIGGVIIACAVIGLVVWQLVSRRRD